MSINHGQLRWRRILGLCVLLVVLAIIAGAVASRLRRSRSIVPAMEAYTVDVNASDWKTRVSLLTWDDLSRTTWSAPLSRSCDASVLEDYRLTAWEEGWDGKSKQPPFPSPDLMPAPILDQVRITLGNGARSTARHGRLLKVRDDSGWHRRVFSGTEWSAVALDGVQQEKIRELVSELATSHAAFVRMPIVKTTPSTGMTVMLEACVHGQYAFYFRWTPKASPPRDKAFVQLADLLLSVAGRPTYKDRTNDPTMFFPL